MPFSRGDGNVRAFCFSGPCCSHGPPGRQSHDLMTGHRPVATVLMTVLQMKARHARVTRRAVSAAVISACLGFLSQGPDAPELFLPYHPQTSSRRDRSHCLLPL